VEPILAAVTSAEEENRSGHVWWVLYSTWSNDHEEESTWADPLRDKYEREWVTRKSRHKAICVAYGD
jgi:hypothetical protein